MKLILITVWSLYWFHGSGFVFVEPVGKVLLEERSFSSLMYTGHIRPIGIALLFNEILRRQSIIVDNMEKLILIMNGNIQQHS